VANDDISDLGAMTATSPWIYNQVGVNLTGVVVVLLGLGLWRALSPDVIGRIGTALLIAEGTSTFFDSIFHFDCQGIDAACDDVSWHSRAHKIESDFTAALSLLAPPANPAPCPLGTAGRLAFLGSCQHEHSVPERAGVEAVAVGGERQGFDAAGGKAVVEWPPGEAAVDAANTPAPVLALLAGQDLERLL
jgi:uncharacterized protein DUF998